MKDLWQRLLKDETGVVISSELALVGTVAVLGSVVGLEAVSTAVTQELTDLSSAFRSLNQSFSFRSISKGAHARVSGSCFTDIGGGNNNLLAQNDVAGQFGGSGSSQLFLGNNTPLLLPNAAPVLLPNAAPVLLSPAPQIQRVPVLEGRVLECPVEAAATDCPDDEIIEEHIIRRRVKANSAATLSDDCAMNSQNNVPLKSKNSAKSVPASKPPVEKIEIKKPKK